MTTEQITTQQMLSSMMSLHQYIEANREQFPVRTLRGPIQIGRDDAFSIESDRKIILFLLKPSSAGKMQSKTLYRRLKNEKFNDDARITSEILFKRAQKICRPIREHRLYEILSCNIEFDQGSEEHKTVRSVIEYLRYYVLGYHENRPNLPYNPNSQNTEN